MFKKYSRCCLITVIFLFGASLFFISGCGKKADPVPVTLYMIKEVENV